MIKCLKKDKSIIISQYIIYDLALEKEYSVTGDVNSIKTISSINRECMINIEYDSVLEKIFRRFSLNHVERFDIKGFRLYEIFISVMGKMTTFFSPIITIFTAVLYLLSNNIYFSLIIAAFFFNFIMILSLHESLHLYLFRKYKNKELGILAWKNMSISVYLPNLPMSNKNRILISIVPAITNFIIGVLLFLVVFFVKNEIVQFCVRVFFIFPWIFNIFSIIPLASDGKHLISAIKSIKHKNNDK
ncbi:hypothetical protein CFB3_22990 [Clostridium folliculivorans]|nr:hypothetical protein CFB3_22990 [Clostridium folliculivorans]